MQILYAVGYQYRESFFQGCPRDTDNKIVMRLIRKNTIPLRGPFNYALVALDKFIILKEGIEHWLGDHVLGKHLDRVLLVDGGIQVALQGRKEFLEFRRDFWLLDQQLDFVNMAVSDVGNVLCPRLPISAGAALFDDLGIDAVFHFCRSSRFKLSCV